MSDDWDFYLCSVDDKPASIYVNLDLKASAPDSDLASMAWLRLYMRYPREDGLSSQAEFNKLSEIEDAILAAMNVAAGRIVYVGRNTSDGCRDFFFYCTNEKDAQSCLSQCMEPFPEYKYEIGARPDPSWRTYLKFLYPSKKMFQTILNRGVIETLEKHGDNHQIERKIWHWIYFESHIDRDTFLQSASQKGYSFESQHDEGKSPFFFSLTISCLSSVDYHTINAIVLELFDLAETNRGTYDGWETSVEKVN